MFVLEVPACKAAVITKVTRNSAQRVYTKIRIAIARDCERHSPFSGEIEVDESYLRTRRIKGKRGRGSYEKTIEFGILESDGKVYI